MWTSACTWSPYCDAKDPSCVKTEKRKRAWSADQTHHSSCVKCVTWPFTCVLLKFLHTGSDHRPVVFTDTHKPAGNNDRSAQQIHQDFVPAACAPVKHPVWCLRTHCGFLFLLGTSSLIFCSPTKMRWDSLKSLRRMGEQISSSFLTMWTNGEPADFRPEQEYMWWDLWQFSCPFTHTQTVFPELILDINTL